jgi:hypothetical protein
VSAKSKSTAKRRLLSGAISGEQGEFGSGLTQRFVQLTLILSHKKPRRGPFTVFCR